MSIQLLYPLDLNSDEDALYKFNCGGFALQTYDWYVPNTWYDMDDGSFTLDEIDDLLERAAIDIENDYNEFHKDSFLVQIPHYIAAPIGQEVVAFRLDVQLNLDEDEYTLHHIDDFHFLWRDRNGFWWDKQGGLEVKAYDDDPEDDWWNDRYNSSIVWFAKHMIQ